jgi:thymidylate synthase
LDIDCRDAACATSIQFLVREGRLDAVVCMRSNDAIWGLPYDVFLFTFLQELLALTLGFDLGSYHHFASSLHIYQKHLALASRVVESGLPEQFSMRPMQDPEMLKTFLALERDIRMDNRSSPTASTSAYWQSLVEVLWLFRKSRESGWSSALESISSIDYLPVLEPLSIGRGGLPVLGRSA